MWQFGLQGKGVDNPELSFILDIDGPPRHWHAAKFILNIKERHTLSQCAVDCITSSATSLISSVNDGILSELKENHEVPENVVKVLENKFESVETIFSGLSNAYQQRKYFREDFHKIVSQWYTCMHTCAK